MILYQYRGSLSDPKKFHYFVDLITKGSMMFSRPSDFNDPFDCCPTQFRELPPGELPHAVTDELNKHIQHATSHVLGVSCLTPHPDKMLMWSHYGDQHKSICVGFDRDTLLENIPTNSKGNPLYTEIREVEYTNTRPNEEDKEAIFKKSEEWEYEDEYRIVSLAKKGHPQWGPGVWNVPLSAIKEVVIGARVERSMQEEIVKAVRSNNSEMEIQKAVLHTHSFDLIIEKICDQPKVTPMSGFLHGPNGNWINT